MRMKTNTSINTQEAQRIAKRLLNHWKHKFEVSENDQLMSIFMPEATVEMHIHPDHLEVVLATEKEDYQRLQKVIIDHLDRMAQQQFEVTWSAPH